MSDMAVIEIKLRTDGRVDMRSSFMGRQDAAYAPLAQSRVGVEVEKLALELRQQMVSQLRGQLALCESALPKPSQE